MFAAEIRKRRVSHMRGYPQWRRHLDEAFVKVNGKLRYLWRAVDHEGEVLEAVVTSKRDKAAALKLLKRIMKKYGPPQRIVIDRLRAYSAAMNDIGCSRSARGRRVGSTIGWRIRISRFDDANGRCSGFEAEGERPRRVNRRSIGEHERLRCSLTRRHRARRHVSNDDRDRASPKTTVEFAHHFMIL